MPKTTVNLVGLQPQDILVYEAIKAHFRRHKYSPTYRELGEKVGAEAPAVLRSLNRLSENGLITKKPRKSRTIQLVEDVR
jgi:predicted transcriptional regulator